MAQDGFTLKADKNLTADINKATTPEEIRALLENAMARSGIADRDPETGQFVRREPLTPAAQTAAQTAADAAVKQPQQFEKTEVIGGQEFHFSEGSEVALERAISNAYRVAEAVKNEPLTHVKTQAEIEQEICDRAELELKFKRGEISAKDYIQQSGAIDEVLAESGFDVQAAASAQFETNWSEAVDIFFQTPEGQTWKGGAKNLSLANSLIISHGWVDADDKVAALRAVAKEMREKGLEFDGDVSPEQVIESTRNASPQEILEAWKSQQASPEAANEAFIEIHRGSSGIFNR